jgi:hypothetical protein
MSGRTYYITGDLPYYVIECDSCGIAYARYDDFCYSWTALRSIANDDGWLTGERVDGPCLCGICGETTRDTQQAIARTVPGLRTRMPHLPPRKSSTTGPSRDG